MIEQSSPSVYNRLIDNEMYTVYKVGGQTVVISSLQTLRAEGTILKTYLGNKITFVLEKESFTNDSLINLLHDMNRALIELGSLN